MSDEEWKIVCPLMLPFEHFADRQFISRELADFLEDRMSD